MRPGHADISQATATTPVLACQVHSEMVVCVQVTMNHCGSLERFVTRLTEHKYLNSSRFTRPSYIL